MQVIDSVKSIPHQDSNMEEEEEEYTMVSEVEMKSRGSE